MNTIAMNQVLLPELDKALVQKPVTGFMIDNALRSKFIGTKTVMIDELDVSGLKDYDRNTGYVQGVVNVSQTPYILKKDRGTSFEIDHEDADESGIADLAGKIIGEFTRTQVVPEVDAYVLSGLAGIAANEEQLINGTPATEAYAMFRRCLDEVWDAVGSDEELVAFVDRTFHSALTSTPEISRHIEVSNFTRGKVNTKVTELDGCPLIKVNTARMKTAYIFNDGTTTDQEEGGFTPTAEAKSIGLLILPKRAASLIKKHEAIRVFDPQTNQRSNGWRIDYRLHYDLIVKNSFKNAIWAYTY